MIAEHFSNLLKLFLPSWNFFNDFSAVPRLDARLIRDGHESDWHHLYANDATSSIRRVLFNAHGNLELLEKTFIERAAEEFASEPHRPRRQKRGDTDGSPTSDAAPGDGLTPPKSSRHYETLARIVRSRLITTQTDCEFQFRLVMTSPGEPEEILFISARHSIKDESR